MTGEETIEIVLNGERRRVRSGTTVGELLGELGLEASAVAVELNRRILRREEVPRQTLAPGDRAEIVRFVQGG